jgi:hypothetical protein
MHPPLTLHLTFPLQEHFDIREHLLSTNVESRWVGTWVEMGRTLLIDPCPPLEPRPFLSLCLILDTFLTQVHAFLRCPPGDCARHPFLAISAEGSGAESAAEAAEAAEPKAAVEGGAAEGAGVSRSVGAEGGSVGGAAPETEAEAAEAEAAEAADEAVAEGVLSTSRSHHSHNASSWAQC